MSFLDAWNLVYPIGDDALDPEFLSVRGRTTSGAGQFELAGAGLTRDGKQIRARDFIGHSISFEVPVPNSSMMIRISERYPVREVGGKVRINVQDQVGGTTRPNIGNLFAALFLLPDVSQIGKASPLQESGFADKTFWIDAISVDISTVDVDTYILQPKRFVFASSHKDNPDQFSGAMVFDFEERLSRLSSICRKGACISAGGVPAALKYYTDLLDGRAAFDYPLGASMRKIIADYLGASDEIDYRIGDDPLDALNTLVASRSQFVSPFSLAPKASPVIPVPRNLIFFGAPGTGKSFQLAELSDKYFDKPCIRRVTFHPEYTYAQFIGCYKPVTTYKNATDEDSDNQATSEITYDFMPGPFLETYISAVQNPGRNFLLIVEEINRANPAATFGDVFQLLDRDNEGRSEYEIAVPGEMCDYLKMHLPEYATTAYISDPIQLLSEQQRLKGEAARLSIPPNMFLWATMNSADQGVFPMDTAFKRRWDFRYMDINDESAVAKIESYSVPLGDTGERVNWNSLRVGINNVLRRANINEDKWLGPFFMKPAVLSDDDSFINAFKDKVLLYLYEDAAKSKPGKVFADKSLTYSELCKAFVKTGTDVFFEFDESDIVTLSSRNDNPEHDGTEEA